MTMLEVMRLCRNFFAAEVLTGTWTSRDGALTQPLPPDKMVLLRLQGLTERLGVTDAAGSLSALPDGEWQGRITVCEPPEDFTALCAEIGEWAERHPETGISSERAGEVSVRYAAGGWPAVFSARLAPYRRMWRDAG